MSGTRESTKSVTVIEGDGVGPEVVRATLRVLDATGVPLTWERVEAGAEVFRKGVASGVPRETVDSIARTRVALKGPLETPVGYGEKSANVTLRKLFETFGNLRPVREFPGVPTPYPGRGIDFVIVRENVEDLYAGVEHMQTPGVAQCLKLMSRKGCEKIVRLAFEVARAEGRKSVHCATKANIMKLTEGLLKRTFEDVSREYPDLQTRHIIVDNCAHQLVRAPEQFEVIVTSNMNGDILSDLGSGLIGGLGFAPGANLGVGIAIFEAVHGSAPKYAGKGVINPTALLLSGVMMLRYLGEFEAAEKVENALLVTLQDGTYTRDVRQQGSSSTHDFASRVIDNLGRAPDGIALRKYRPLTIPDIGPRTDFVVAGARRTVGADVFVESASDIGTLGRSIEELVVGTPFRLKMVSNRGTKVFPVDGTSPDVVDHWRCRFVARTEDALRDEDVLSLLARVGARHRWMHVERLQEFDGAPAFTKAQGED